MRSRPVKKAETGPASCWERFRGERRDIGEATGQGGDKPASINKEE